VVTFRSLSRAGEKPDFLPDSPRKLDLLRRYPGLEPRYWAPFVLIGESVAAVPLRRRSWWHWPFAGLGAGVVLAAAAISFFAARQRSRSPG
jgi:hypothetical protein